MGVEESQRVEWFAEFERLGETQVRLSFEASDWDSQRSKRSCAIEWLRQKEEARALASSSKRDARESKTLRLAKWANIIAITAIAIASKEQISSIISWLIGALGGRP